MAVLEPKLGHPFHANARQKGGVMPLMFVQFAQGEVKDFPYRFKMKQTLRAHRSGETPFRFKLISKGVEQEVEFIEEGGSHGSLRDGFWYTTLIICPVETLETRDGLRIIHIDVDPTGHATYL